MTLGRLYNANAAGGTLDAVLDTSDRDTDSANVITPASAIRSTAAAAARHALAHRASSLTGAAVNRNFVFYLDGVAGRLRGRARQRFGNAGLLEAQYAPPGGTFPDTLLGFFVAGTQFAQTPGPISLVPLLALSYGSLSGTYATASSMLDTAMGRGFGT